MAATHSDTELAYSVASEASVADVADVADEDADLGLSVVDEDEFKEAQALLALGDEPPPQAGFIVAISDRGKMRRLHHLNSCGRRPGEHYTNWIFYGDRIPPDTEIDARCKICFRSGSEKPQPVTDPDDIDSADESDTSSSAAPEPPAKRPRAASSSSSSSSPSSSS